MLGRVGVKACFTYFLTTLVVIIIALSIGKIFESGKGISLNFENRSLALAEDQATPTKIIDILLQIVSDNTIGAMAQGTVSCVLALFTGIAINAMDKGFSNRIGDIYFLNLKS
ncbi:MAG: cation:dicarboxylase symporter family transporter [Candidatus Midichloria sp.]|nr:MAG: cation:dicarboxylase symporter family transporter [Candidatus Midichloria sp.]